MSYSKIVGYCEYSWDFPEGKRQGYEIYIVNEIEPDDGLAGAGCAWRYFKDTPTKPKRVSLEKFDELYKSAKSDFLFKKCKVAYDETGRLDFITWFE